MLTQLIKKRLVKKIPPERIREGNEKPAGATNLFRTLKWYQKTRLLWYIRETAKQGWGGFTQRGGEHKVYVDAAYAIS
jgi:hypothetical protein